MTIEGKLFFMEARERLERLAQCKEGHDVRHYDGWLSRLEEAYKEITRLEAELAEWRNSRDGWILSVETAEAMAVTANAELVAYKEVEDSLQKEIKRLDGELAEARKEKVCQCDDYEKEMKHIDSFFVLGYVHGMKFTGKQFAYCPYCGGRIEE